MLNSIKNGEQYNFVSGSDCSQLPTEDDVQRSESARHTRGTGGQWTKKNQKEKTTAPPPLYSFASQDTEQQNRGEPVCSVCVCHYISISFLISPREQNFWFTGWCTVRLTSASVPKTQWRKCFREKDQQLLLKYVKKEWRDCSWQECNEQFVLCWNCFVKTCESDSLRKINTRSGKRTTVPLRSLIRMLPSNNAE